MSSTDKHWRSRSPQPYLLPEELKVFSCEQYPLYILVANWAFLKGESVTVKDVRTSFSISLRRASDLLEYLTEQGSRNVTAQCFYLPQSGTSKLKRRAWKVTGIKNAYRLAVLAEENKHHANHHI
ncbi:TPA: CaiF/GrlA family transcriptional regulator [Klebsiella aerogenes]|uniref:CaiF/GrlA family transcriptional regulator n=1 Tax=Klebsiella aerogenes TaxID=548 RepID=UPI00292C6623|nr:CaiF/GrlA family transcriptional regulator [Klebsiella aerogenes]HBY1516530.1 CaiF/GrlA family transcriptional regulator [Klebsiella aerogenes]HBY1543775.1 CaiF/GrlA family transcriptional regulator [Klebsiella aerogenes]HBY1605891.1 CaiF/GrlA family transcriptional regulator [Klebsiella aerogenes]HBY1644012.1 CaiF/GrlA family transcriptional regulator [Klebsiella aerogenes]HEC0404227.1 CaiF/GrlA family transcriptional regulator [Klebsiella aerogenes]